jgi:4-diphosphocytidyl-2C-methyl-D-erythritol kinase
MRVALRVGADVPYAYQGGVCWVTGIGDEVKLLNSVVSWPGEVLITKPSVSVPTVDFYSFFREQHPTIEGANDKSMERLWRLSQPGSAFRLEAYLDLIENDFERDVVSFRPEVGEVLKLARYFLPQTTSLTGSGAAIFSLVPASQADLIPKYISSMESVGMTVYRATI